MLAYPKSYHLPGGIVDEPPQRVSPPLKAQAPPSYAPCKIGSAFTCSKKAVM